MPTDLTSFIPLAYLIASVCFILTLLLLSSPKHARLGNLLGSVGMLIAVVGTLIHEDIITYRWIVPGLIVGSLIGASMAAWIPMTKMPERIALSHSFGGLAAALVGVSEYHHRMATEGIDRFTMGALGLEVFLGFLITDRMLRMFKKKKPGERS